MGKKTVKRRIFISNALMVLVTLSILLIINVVFMKAYSEYIEHELKDSIEGVVDEDGLEELLEGYTIRRTLSIRGTLSLKTYAARSMKCAGRFWQGRKKIKSTKKRERAGRDYCGYKREPGICVC